MLKTTQTGAPAPMGKISKLLAHAGFFTFMIGLALTYSMKVDGDYRPPEFVPFITAAIVVMWVSVLVGFASNWRLGFVSGGGAFGCLMIACATLLFGPLWPHQLLMLASAELLISLGLSFTRWERGEK